MAGQAGTARFGVNPDIHNGKTSDGGVSTVDMQSGKSWTEIHFAYNPAQRSREMGTTRGADPGHDNVDVPRQADYMSNHDGYLGGNKTLANLDERKVLTNSIYSVNCEWADPNTSETSDNGWAPTETFGAFD